MYASMVNTNHLRIYSLCVRFFWKHSEKSVPRFWWNRCHFHVALLNSRNSWFVCLFVCLFVCCCCCCYDTQTAQNKHVREGRLEQSSIDLQMLWRLACSVSRSCLEVLTYLCPLLPVEHKPSTAPRDHTLGCSGHSGPVGPLLFQLCFSVSPPTVARTASFSLPLRVQGQGLECGAGCWLPEGVSDPAPLAPRYLLGHWFLSRSLPQIFISDLLLPLDFVDAPQTGVEECLDLLLHRLHCAPCLTSVEQDWLHTGVEDAEFGSHADSSRCPDVFEHDKSCALALPILAVTSRPVPPC